jgi:hypothetical protein
MLVNLKKEMEIHFLQTNGIGVIMEAYPVLFLERMRKYNLSGLRASKVRGYELR